MVTNIVVGVNYYSGYIMVHRQTHHVQFFVSAFFLFTWANVISVSTTVPEYLEPVHLQQQHQRIIHGEEDSISWILHVVIYLRVGQQVHPHGKERAVLHDHRRMIIDQISSRVSDAFFDGVQSETEIDSGRRPEG